MSRVILISLVAILHLDYSHVWSFAEKTHVCLNPECRKFADYILKNIDKRVDPCHDFYDYVCNGWEKNLPRPKHELEWNIERYMRHQALVQLREILEDPAESTNPKVQEAKKLYQLCNNIPYTEELDRDAVKTIILGIQDWPKFICNGEDVPDDLPIWMIDNYYFKRSGESALFGASIRLTAGVDGPIAVHFHTSSSVYGAVGGIQKWMDEDKKNYKLFLTNMFENMMPGNVKYCKENIGKIIRKVLRFREQLTEITYETDDGQHVPMTVKEAQDWHNELTKEIPNARMDWLASVRIIRRSRRDSHGYTIKDDEVIYVQKKYFSNLAELLALTSPSVIVNHIHLYFAETHMIRTPQMIEWLTDSITDNYSPTGVIREHPQRWQKCIENHGMKHTLAKLYIDKYFPFSSKATVKQFMDEAKELLKVQIFSSSWLDLETKKMSKLKINEVKSTIGYPDWLDSLSIETRKKPYILPYQIDAEYMEELHMIYVTAAYLQIPIFTPNLPYVVNYAATISMLGHELYHLIDNIGIYFDEHQGTPWWRRKMVSQYMKHSKCFIDMYTKLKERELKKHGLRGEINGLISLAEDIADAMGLKLAYSGFKLQLLKDDGHCPVLPGFEKHGCDRLFFITFANAFCAAPSSKDLGGLYKNTHTAEKVRVNGAVSNMRQFTQAFSCQKGDRMYVEKPCDLWRD